VLLWLASVNAERAYFTLKTADHHLFRGSLALSQSETVRPRRQGRTRIDFTRL